MRSFSPAGMGTKAYFGLGAKTFGNPGGALSGNGSFHGGGIIPGPPLARLNAFAFLPELGWVAAGIYNENTGAKKSIMRFSSTATGINGLATAANINIPSADPNGMIAVYAVNATPPLFVACDGSGHIVTSTDGVTWIAAINTATATSIQPRMGVIYDDINNKILCAPFGGNIGPAIVLRATPASGTMEFDADVVANTPPRVRAVGYRAGSGVTLALLDQGLVYRSTNGFNWNIVGGSIFGAGVVGSRGVFYAGVGHGTTHNWLFFGGDSSNLLVQSLDDGATYTAPVVWTSLVSAAANAPVSMAADFAGNLVMQTNQPGVSPAVSHDFGSSWGFPNLISMNAGTFGTVWDGTKWNSAGAATSGLAPPNFFMTSPDGSNWTPGPNQVP